MSGNLHQLLSSGKQPSIINSASLAQFVGLLSKTMFRGFETMDKKRHWNADFKFVFWDTT